MNIPGSYKQAAAGDRVCILTVLLAVPADANFEDYLSSLLSEREAVNPESPIMDWQYTDTKRIVIASGNEAEGEIFDVKDFNVTLADGRNIDYRAEDEQFAVTDTDGLIENLLPGDDGYDAIRELAFTASRPRA